MASTFTSLVSAPGGEQGPAHWFIFQGDRLLMQLRGETAEMPQAAAAEALGLAPLRTVYLGSLQQDDGPRVDCYGGEIAPDVALPEGMIAEGLRQAYPLLGEALFGVAGRAIQLVTWDRTHQFCGQCGALTERLDHERGRHCQHCALTSYPRLSPAVILAVIRRTRSEAGGPRREILLARNHRFPPGRYSVLAGYVEPGETLEECAQREVAEEVGVRIRGLRYFGSQPWPFPNSLMIGFTAAYAGGELALDASELADAGWFAPEALPDLPPKMTIARRLIDWFVAG